MLISPASDWPDGSEFLENRVCFILKRKNEAVKTFEEKALLCRLKLLIEIFEFVI